MRPVIYCADIGSVPRGRFGWARTGVGQDGIEAHRGGTEIVHLVDDIAGDLAAGRAVALGFECPLFVPVPDEPLQLGKARSGERDRSWSAAAGAGAMATGIVQVAWILSELRRRCPLATAYLDWDELAAAGGGLLLWEAFVTGSAKALTHVDDAGAAVAAFVNAMPDPSVANAVSVQRPLSLLGTALLWSGWACDIKVLRMPCLVIRAGDILPVPYGETLATDAGMASMESASSNERPLRDRVSSIAAQIPEGLWTSYGDIAAAIGSGARAVATCMRTVPIPTAHRVLNAKGEVAQGFRWPNGRTDDPVELLEHEGIRFLEGRADPRQRWRMGDL
jgi:alkylated DNA nucleotide flippase Atl1